MEFMKKYIHIAKLIKPKLSEEASTVIAKEYARLRSLNTESSQMARTQPITARSLETMIRLSTAHARSRMSKLVTKDDALVAIELVQFAYFKRVLEKEKKKRKQHDEDEEDMEVDADDADGNEKDDEEEGRSAAKRLRKDGPENSEDPHDLDSEEAESRKKKLPDSEADTEETMEVEEELSDQRLKNFKARLSTLFTNEREASLSLDKVLEWMLDESQNFTRGEVLGSLKRMEAAGEIFQAEGIVFIIS